MKQQRGGTILGFIIGVVVGLAGALAVAVYVTKVPVPFMNKGQTRSADQDAEEAKKNKDWDPNAPLYGKNPAKPPQPQASAPVAAPVAVAPAVGAKPEAKAEPVTQQDRMKACNKDAADKKGDDRKKFMSECLSADAKPAATAQQSKMKTCNADQKAKTLKGDERKKFMSECLKG